MTASDYLVVERLEAKVEDLRADNERLRAALEPFVRVANILDALPKPPTDDVPLRDAMPGAWPTVGDAREARRALETKLVGSLQADR